MMELVWGESRRPGTSPPYPLRRRRDHSEPSTVREIAQTAIELQRARSKSLLDADGQRVGPAFFEERVAFTEE